MKTVTMYELSAANYKKNGTLKKAAQPELSLTISDHLDDKDHSKEDNAYIAERLIKTLKQAAPTVSPRFSSPYIFTHIRATTGLKTYAIYETVTVAGRELITSPIKLLEALNK